MRLVSQAAAAALVLAITVGCGGGSSADRKSSPSPSGSAPAGTPADLQSYYSQRPTWTDCSSGFQCATVRVPVDYAKPAGESIKLAIIRLPAKNKSARIGSLLTNPGGPGGSGVEFVRDAARLFGTELQNRFDLVGFDPRGVGQSDPVRCLSSQQLDKFFEADASPDDRAEVATLVAGSKEFAAGCGQRAGARLPYVGTINAARDMDVLRAALGDDKLSYFGASYGTYLGAFYADQFPGKVRAFVLDGAVDPKLSATDLLIEQSQGFETALRAFAADCVKQSDCPLGAGGVDAAIAKISALQRQTDRTPLSNSSGDGRTINEAWVTIGIAAALYQREAWPVLRQALTRAYSGDGTILLRLADILVERKQDGSYSNQSEANMAVNCIDKPNPPDAAAFEKDVAKAVKVAPRFGSFVVWGGLPCVYWPVKPTEKPKALTASGAAPILVIGTLRDPATPYKWSQNLAGELSSGVLLTYDGDGHTAYLQGTPCIRTATERYLLTAQPPKKGTTC